MRTRRVMAVHARWAMAVHTRLAAVQCGWRRRTLDESPSVAAEGGGAPAVGCWVRWAATAVNIRRAALAFTQRAAVAHPRRAALEVHPRRAAVAHLVGGPVVQLPDAALLMRRTRPGGSALQGGVHAACRPWCGVLRRWRVRGSGSGSALATGSSGDTHRRERGDDAHAATAAAHSQRSAAAHALWATAHHGGGQRRRTRGGQRGVHAAGSAAYTRPAWWCSTFTGCGASGCA